ncbi:MAG: TlpA disulfide reductase family protein [Rubricella sp.]
MKLGKACLAVFYAACLLGANAVSAQTLAERLGAMREGDMRMLVVHDEAQAFPQTPYTDPAGGTHSIADHAGRVVLLNFWATWCAPCREEMPDLDALQADLGGEDFAVVPVATGRNAVPGIQRFFEETGVEALPILLDERSRLARDAGVLGLPVTVLIDREGREIGRLQGAAHWNAPEARAIIEAAIAAE